MAEAELPAEAEHLLAKCCDAVKAIRHRPLLILYYPERSHIDYEDVEQCYEVFRGSGITPENSLANLDVLIHTNGGLVDPAYQLALVVRLFAGHVAYLVPERAVSAGTLQCLSANEIYLGHLASLGPLDITVGEVGLASIDGLLEFAVEGQRKLVEYCEGAPSDMIASATITKLIDELGATRLGVLFKERKLTEEYAKELLSRYMFSDRKRAKKVADRIAKFLVYSRPTHEFHIDIDLARQVGLKVTRMPTALHDAANSVVEVLREHEDIFCPLIIEDLRAPYIAIV